LRKRWLVALILSQPAENPRDRVDSIDANDPLLASTQTRWAHLQQPRKSGTGVLL
jgi:hypothetical protein